MINLNKLHFLALFIVTGLASQQATHAQNVGIGTATPAQKLEIQGWVELGNETEGAGAAGTAGALRYNTGGFLEYHDGTAWQGLEAGWLLSGNAGTNVNTNYLGTSDNEDLSIRTGATEAIRVNTQQEVGIGTTNPGARLEINQNGTGISDGMRIRGGATNAQDWYFFKDADDDLIIRDDASNVVTFQNSTDNVGINVGNPQATLHVDGNSNFCADVFDGFESGFGNWNNVTTDDDDWQTNSGSTGSFNTGPSGASEGTQYIYTETSSSASGDLFVIEQSLDLTNCTSSAQITFDYHMFFGGDADGGTLELIVDDGTANTVWSRSGDQGTNWNSANVDLSAFAGNNVTLRFRFEVGTNTDFQNDAALDNIRILGGLEVTNSTFRLTDGNQQVGHVLTSNADGDAFWAEPGFLTSTTEPDDDWTVDGMQMYSADLNRRVGFGTDNVDNDYTIEIYEEDSGATGTTFGIGSVEEIVDASSETTINNDFSPARDATLDLGGNSLRWDNVFAANGTIQTSDRHQKQDIQPLNYGLNEVMALRPIRYKWKRDQLGETHISDDKKKAKIGFVAQDVEPVVREVVYKYDWDVKNEDEPNTFVKKKMENIGMNYGELVPVLVKAIQEQQAQIDALQKEVKQLKQAPSQN